MARPRTVAAEVTLGDTVATEPRPYRKADAPGSKKIDVFVRSPLFTAGGVVDAFEGIGRRILFDGEFPGANESSVIEFEHDGYRYTVKIEQAS